jgi:hypothetical protein
MQVTKKEAISNETTEHDKMLQNIFLEGSGEVYDLYDENRVAFAI